MSYSRLIETLRNAMSKDTRTESRAVFISSPNNNEWPWKFNGKCSVCNAWGFDVDNYCANCGKKFEKEKEK